MVDHEDALVARQRAKKAANRGQRYLAEAKRFAELGRDYFERAKRYETSAKAMRNHALSLHAKVLTVMAAAFLLGCGFGALVASLA